MSTVYSDQQTYLNKNQFVARGSYGQPLAVSWDTYPAAALVSGSTIYGWTPPKGFKFSGGKLYNAALGSSVTLAVGVLASTNDPTTYPSDTTKFLGTTSCQAAGSNVLAPVIANADYVFDGFTQLIITIGGATATGAIKLRIDGTMAI